MSISEREMEFNWESDSLSLADTMFMDKGMLVSHHIDSFNHFVRNGLPHIMAENSPIRVPIEYSVDRKMVTLEYCIELGDVYVTHPVINEPDGTVKQMYPNDARLRNLSYSAPHYMDLRHRLIRRDVKTGKEEIKEFPPVLRHPMGKLPIMVGSDFCILSEKTGKTRGEMGECKYDYGGYFIIGGAEKVLVSQERKAENKVYVFPVGRTNVQKFSHIAEINSVPYTNKNIQKQCRVMMMARDTGIGRTLKVNIQRFQKSEWPLFVVFRALGVISDKEIVDMIVPDGNIEYLRLLQPSIEESAPITTQDLALRYLSQYMTYGPKLVPGEETEEMLKQVLGYTRQVLLREFLPHQGEDPKKKAYFLGYMTRMVLQNVLHVLPPDDRDSFLNKRIETSGELMENLYREVFNKTIRDVLNSVRIDKNAGRIEELATSLSKRFKPTNLENNLRWSLSTGNWGLKNKKTRKGIAQQLSRLSYIGFISNLRRIVAPIARDLKSEKPRLLHSTQFGYICPSETPEGQNVGLVKNMALTCMVTMAMSEEPIRKILDDQGVRDLSKISTLDLMISTKVFVNGAWIGIHPKAKLLVDNLKSMRRKGVIHPMTGITWLAFKGELHIYTDGGRLTRPLYVIEDNKYMISDPVNLEKFREVIERKRNWMTLIVDGSDDPGSIEYIDMEEANSVMIAMTDEYLRVNDPSNPVFYRYTHGEIFPALMLGAVVCNVPFSNHTQAPRNLFQGAMGKQGLGIYATNFRKRMDTTAHVLHYPQKALVDSRLASYVNSDILPPGAVPIVAIAVYTGYNQEDSLIFNKSSVDRGLFISTHYKTFKDEEVKNTSTLKDERFCKPQKYYPNKTIKTVGMKGGSYEKLDDSGLVRVGEHVEPGDVIIGKIIPIEGASEGEPFYRDASQSIKKNQGGIVDMVYMGRNDASYRIVKVRLREERVPDVGDKFAGRRGQKGTIGITYREEDMPYTKDGIRPDIIMSPQALPKRMTIDHLIEASAGKLGAVLGRYLDATPFMKHSAHNIEDALMHVGFKYGGKEVLYNGRTGIPMTAKIFIGPIFYYKLKHMVNDKVHSRKTGPYQMLTRQPAEGRSRDGGLRVGEMERDVMLAHGMAGFLKERLFDSSDKYQFYVCKKTGLIAAVNPEKGVYKSLYDPENKTDFAKVQIPYATKLLIQELMGMGVSPRLITKAF